MVMKKNILLALVCCAHCALAQKSFFGVDAGINVANQRTHIISTSPNFTTSGSGFGQNVVKPTVSVFYQLNVNDQMGLRLNASYMGMGYQQVGTNNDNVEINYLTFPLAFHYYVNKYLSFNAGPYLSFTLGGSKINNQPITSTYHKNDAGFNIGGEHIIYRNLSIAATYVIGLKNIILDDSIFISDGTTTTKIGEIKRTNRALQFTLIYKFKKAN
jgi:Outer membrane protein beta-barrel domain